MHEASLHEESCFVTLTYSPENLPGDGSLRKQDFQGFMKRLRARFSCQTIRYFHCGEYGAQLGRPHYHACIFGIDFPDKVFYKPAGEARLYSSALLERIWSYGFCTVGDVTFESAAYVARYIMKKVTGDLAKEHYLCVDNDTGEIACDARGDLCVRQPEYVTMSRRPGIGRAWYQSFFNEVFPSDEVIARGVKCRPPRYYDNLFEAGGGDLEAVKRSRVERAFKHVADCVPERLKVRERCVKARVALLKRGFEGGEREP
jgi:hypothetical protein